MRPHWALIPTEGGDPAAPADVYRRGVEVPVPARQGWAGEAKGYPEDLFRQDAEAA